MQTDMDTPRLSTLLQLKWAREEATRLSVELEAKIALRVVEQASWEKVTLAGRPRSRRSLTLDCRRARFLSPRRREGEGELGGTRGRRIGGGSADGCGSNP